MSVDTNTEKALRQRSNSKCELCGVIDNLIVYAVPPNPEGKVDDSVLICETCHEQIENPEKADVNHWRCLNDSIWSQVPAVQVMSLRMLVQLNTSDSTLSWPQDTLDIIYLEDDTLNWAKAGIGDQSAENNIKHLDSNGSALEAGDTVTLIKDLNVKGANFTAKRGTAVRGISLVADNSEHIEGKINGQQIVILTRFVKKAN